MAADISGDADGDRPNAPPISRRLANALGILTILAWGSLGLLGKEASSLPPFFVLAVCFAGATAMGLALIMAMPRPACGVFFLWDIALKNGDAAWLAVLGYAAPVVSTALLIAAGYADPSIRIVAATALIALGGVASAGSSTSTSDKPSMG